MSFIRYAHICLVRRNKLFQQEKIYFWSKQLEEKLYGHCTQSIFTTMKKRKEILKSIICIIKLVTTQYRSLYKEEYIQKLRTTKGNNK